MDQSTREPSRAEATLIPVPQVIIEIEAAFTAGDLERTAELIEHDFLASWFYVIPSRIAEIFAALLRSREVTNPFVQTVGALLFAEKMGESLSPAFAQAQVAAEKHGLPVKQLALIGQMFGLRVRGRPVEALSVADGLARLNAAVPIFDPTLGWGLFTATQNGVTAMLAGEFSRALTHFTDARLQTPHPSLGFLVRDACAKSALIESLFGDERKARALLADIDRTPRTQSWAEAGTDAARTIVEAVLPETRPADAIDLLDTVRLSALGEVWPFYVAAVLRRSIEVGDLAECQRRLSRFDQLALPYVSGQGFTGSVLSLASALIAMAYGQLGEAREKLESTDPRCPDSATTLAVLELSADRPQQALRLTARSRDRVRGLRLLEMIRYAVNAGAHLALGEEQACAGTLEMALSMPGGMRAEEAGLFSAEVRAFAEQRFSAWPREPAPSRVGFELFGAQRVAFTRREIEILRCLGRGLSRDEIAQEHFISVNTVKSHLRVIYRKLDVSSYNAAMLEAERRGLL